MIFRASEKVDDPLNHCSWFWIDRIIQTHSRKSQIISLFLENPTTHKTQISKTMRADKLSRSDGAVHENIDYGINLFKNAKWES